ncbi:hypothetical protein BC777_1896 [Yoonia maricola]|uniref:Uncharacterized protein n=1 Tax=Yoonia maricola TaxID=420999 RepID=A0A2M8WQ14_9RHOB|nr:hypothetical protein [Yoonia maricola]PJI93029.1 hypothetical protein BC777_1896 [Yoonia maricola]
MELRRPKAMLLGLALIGIVMTACHTIKPLRSLAPETFGLTCVTDTLCVEDPDTAPQAQRLATEAMRFVEVKIGSIQQTPKFQFCSTIRCFNRFGHSEFRAQYVWGANTIVVNAAGWEDYIIRHEVIHHLQAEHFGLIKASSLPRWFIEGMAYTLSEDPRNPLPRDDIEQYRQQFVHWLEAGNDWRLGPEQHAP